MITPRRQHAADTDITPRQPLQRRLLSPPAYAFRRAMRFRFRCALLAFMPP